jgi:hypothetical protein
MGLATMSLCFLKHFSDTDFVWSYSSVETPSPLPIRHLACRHSRAVHHGDCEIYHKIFFWFLYNLFLVSAKLKVYSSHHTKLSTVISSKKYEILNEDQFHSIVQRGPGILSVARYHLERKF